MTLRPLTALAILGLLAACKADKTSSYTDTYVTPNAAGLVAVRPYPTPDDVCQVIGENDNTVDLLDHEFLLIGCPSHERGAIKDRIRDGAVVLKDINGWTLLNLRIR